MVCGTVRRIFGYHRERADERNRQSIRQDPLGRQELPTFADWRKTMKRNNRVARRTFVQTGLLLPAAGLTQAASTTPTSSEIYARLGVRTFINAVGTLTTLSGTLMAPEVVQAMEQASRNFVAIHELQNKVGKRLAELTGA